jgi:hypothetical protein
VVRRANACIPNKSNAPPPLQPIMRPLLVCSRVLMPCSRWVLPPHTTLDLVVQFSSADIGKFTERINFEVRLQANAAVRAGGPSARS